EGIHVFHAQSQVLEKRAEVRPGETPSHGRKQDRDPDRRIRHRAGDELTADVEHAVARDAGEDGPRSRTAQRERERQQREQKQSAVRDAARTTDQRVGMASRPAETRGSPMWGAVVASSATSTCRRLSVPARTASLNPQPAKAFGSTSLPFSPPVSTPNTPFTTTSKRPKRRPAASRNSTSPW